MVEVLWLFKHANSGYVIPGIVENLLVRPIV